MIEGELQVYKRVDALCLGNRYCVLTERAFVHSEMVHSEIVANRPPIGRAVHSGVMGKCGGEVKAQIMKSKPEGDARLGDGKKRIILRVR